MSRLVIDIHTPRSGAIGVRIGEIIIEQPPRP